MNFLNLLIAYVLLHLLASSLGLEFHPQIASNGHKNVANNSYVKDESTFFRLSTNHISSIDIATATIYIIKERCKLRLKPGKLVLLYLPFISLANSYTPEPNPGPRAPKYPCGSCQKAVTWKTPGVCCDPCDRWYHKSCIGMNTLVYQGLHNVSWNCDLCGLPNFSSCIFDTSVFLCPTVYDTFNDASFCDSNIGSPTAASSPIQKSNPQLHHHQYTKVNLTKQTMLNTKYMTSH